MMLSLTGPDSIGAQPPPSSSDPSVAPQSERLTEARAIARIKALLIAQVQEQFREQGRPARRDAHAKAQGCVKARFSVERSLPASLRVGVFARPQTFTAWIRYSNAVGSNDRLGLARGMAIKLTGVDGRKILPLEANETTQDFLLVNYPVFNVAKDTDYAEFLAKSASGRLSDFFKKHERAGQITAAIAAQRIGNPLRLQYFSMTPYAYGSRYVKYSTLPVSCANGGRLFDRPPSPLPDNPNYLRAAMTRALASGPSCFSFAVQFQTDPRSMPIEDSTVLWSTEKSPFITVASIDIPRQRFDSAAQQSFCENLSYTPWHSLPEHRPVGNINRIRRVVYDTISALRHRLNGISRTEPTGNEHFEGGPIW